MIKLKLSNNPQANLFIIIIFKLSNMAGESKYIFKQTRDFEK